MRGGDRDGRPAGSLPGLMNVANRIGSPIPMNFDERIGEWKRLQELPHSVVKVHQDEDASITLFGRQTSSGRGALLLPHSAGKIHPGARMHAQYDCPGRCYDGQKCSRSPIYRGTDPCGRPADQHFLSLYNSLFSDHNSRMDKEVPGKRAGTGGCHLYCRNVPWFLGFSWI